MRHTVICACAQSCTCQCPLLGALPGSLVSWHSSAYGRLSSVTRRDIALVSGVARFKTFDTSEACSPRCPVTLLASDFGRVSSGPGYLTYLTLRCQAPDRAASGHRLRRQQRPAARAIDLGHAAAVSHTGTGTWDVPGLSGINLRVANLNRRSWQCPSHWQARALKIQIGHLPVFQGPGLHGDAR